MAFHSDRVVNEHEWSPRERAIFNLQVEYSTVTRVHKNRFSPSKNLKTPEPFSSALSFYKGIPFTRNRGTTSDNSEQEKFPRAVQSDRV